LAHNPEVVFLDEPEAGLDVQGLETLLAQIRVRSDTGLTTIAATHHGLTIEHASDLMLLNAGEVVFKGSKTGFIDDFVGNTVLELNTEGLSVQNIEQISAFGNVNCFDGESKAKLLVFGSSRDFNDMKVSADLNIEKRSILRKTNPSDLLTWINNRSATKCVP
jgi:ABC-type multidrug transport system ATPase subunit